MSDRVPVKALAGAGILLGVVTNVTAGAGGHPPGWSASDVSALLGEGRHTLTRSP